MAQAAATWVFSEVYLVAGEAAAYLAAGATYVGVTAAVTVGLSKASAAIAGKPKGLSSMQSRTMVLRDTTSPRSIIYGEVVTGGVMVYLNTTGDNNEFCDMVIAIAGHEITEISDVWFDDERIPNSAINSGSVDGGAVGTYTNTDVSTSQPGRYRPRNSKPTAYIYKYLGGDAQAASSTLVDAYPLEWTTDHRLRGVAYVHIRLRRHADAYPQGAPGNFRFKVKGAKVYDPRKDDTNGGTGSHRYEIPSTWEFSSNPALCIADFVIGGSITNSGTRVNMRGFGAGTGDVAWDDVITCAQICDEQVLVPTGGSPESVYQARYTCDGALSAGESTSENLEQLLTCMLGQVVYTGGRYRMFCGAYDTPTLSLTASDLAGGISYTTGATRGERYNAVKGVRWDSDSGQEVEFLPRTSASYELEDGGTRLYRDIELPFTLDEYRAQRIAQIILRRSREQQELVWRGNMGCLRVGVWETVYVTVAELGITNKVFRCIARSVETDSADAIVELTLREEFSATYTDPVLGDYNDLSPIEPEYVAPDGLDPPVALTTTPVAGGIQFNITPDDSNPTSVLHDIAEYSASTPVTSATVIWSGSATAITIPKSDQTTRYYWCRARLNSAVSPWYPDGAGVSGYALESGAGPQGEPAISAVLTRVHASVWAYANGVVLSLDNANGYMRVYEGGTLVNAALVTFSVVSQAGCTGTIDATGYYEVTSMSADEATLVLRAVYGGTTIDLWFTLSKTIAGYEIVNTLPTTDLFDGRIVFLTTDGRLWRYVTSTSPAGWTTAVPATDIEGELQAAQIAAGAIEASKFAAGLRPVEVLAALPSSGNMEGRTVYLTSDGKLYRYSLDTSPQGWTAEVDGADIRANSITAGQIAAGAIKAEALLIRSGGGALNFDPDFRDPTAWEYAAGYGNTAEFVTITDGRVGTNAVRNYFGEVAILWSAQPVPIDPAKTYRVRCWARTTSGSGYRLYMGVKLNDAAGANIGGDGTYWYYAASGVTVPFGWTEYTGRFGAGTARTIPSNARTMSALLLSGYGGEAVHEVQDLRIEEAVGSTLIADGAITTDRIAANAITTAKLAAGSITANEIASNTITANNILTGTITAAKMATNTITAVSGVLADAVITTAKIQDLSVDTIKIANGAVSAGYTVWNDYGTAGVAGPIGVVTTPATWYVLNLNGATVQISMSSVPLAGARVAFWFFANAMRYGNTGEDVRIRCRRSSDSQILTGTPLMRFSNEQQVYAWQFIDDAPNTATPTYIIEVSKQSGGTGQIGRWYSTMLFGSLFKK